MRVPYAKNKPVTLVGGGDVDRPTLERALRCAPHLVAADGGADRAMALGARPELVLGDLDSLSDTARAELGPDRLVQIADQNLTDFDKALGALGAPLVLALGFTGDRLDHTLAAMNTLAQHKGRRVVLDARQDLCLLAPPRLTLDLPAQTRVSLFPLTTLGCQTTGLVWPTESLIFEPTARIGTSNAAVGGPVTIIPEGPGMLLILPTAVFDTVVAAYAKAAVWPDEPG